MLYQSLVTVVLAGLSSVVASPVSPRSDPRTVPQLIADPAINSLFTPEQINTLVKNANRIEIAADVDGTLTIAGTHISNRTLASMYPLDVVIITANCEEKVREASSNYPSMIWEQNAGSLFNGTCRIHLSEEELDAAGPFIKEAAQYMAAKHPEFIFIEKIAGYALSFDMEDQCSADPYKWLQAYDFMRHQAETDPIEGRFKIQPTINAMDLTLTRLNKGDAFTEMKEWKGPDAFWIVLGDTLMTDGPMLALADMGITVFKEFGDYIHFPQIIDTTVLFEWVFELKNAPDLECGNMGCGSATW